jgi:tight adherence protein C
MLDFVLAKLSDGHFLAVLLASIGCAATVIMALTPFLQEDNLERRIKEVSVERERIRVRERERLLAQQNVNKAQLRLSASGMTKQIVDTFNLTNWLSTETAKQMLAQAGFRGAGPEYAFLTFRLVAPIVFFLVALAYVFFIAHFEISPIMKVAVSMGVAYLGIKAPEIYLANKTKKRQRAMNRAYPNMVDLLIICAEAGMSIENSVRKVSVEIGAESIDLAEELSLLAAELSYLEHRRNAFENFTNRTGIDAIKQLTTVLIQSEKYGTPLGSSLRVLAAESRDQRMQAAEKKAAALPPTLTVPMILFFLPGLFCAILGPAVIQINHWN